MDVVFYRNVSIYFNPETQKNIFKKLSDLINENGYLFVGSTETISHDIGILSLVEMDGIFLFRKMKKSDKMREPLKIETRDKKQETSKDNAPSNPPLKIRGGSGSYDPPIHPFTDSSSVQSLFNEALSLAVGKNHDAALSRIDKLIEHDQSFIKAYMLKAGILINLNLLEDAKSICLKSIGIDRWCLEGHLLLALIAKMQDDREAALKRFKEAVYIQPSCWLAHFYLAEIYNSSRDLKNACREYEITIRQLAKGEIENHGLTFFQLSFSAEQILHLCRKNLSELKVVLR